MANRTVDDRTEMPCTRCGQIRPVSRFSIVKERLKNGETRQYYVSVCKYCVSERKDQKGENMLPGSRQTSLSVFSNGETMCTSSVQESPALTGTPLKGGEESPVQESPRCKRCVHYSLIRHKCKTRQCDYDEFLGYAMPCEI